MTTARREDEGELHREDEAIARLPETLREIAEVVGLEATNKLVEARGGTKVYFPVAAGDDHWLVECVGREAADKLCSHFCADLPSDAEQSLHGADIVLPVGFTSSRAKARRRAMDVLLGGGTNSQAARASGLHVRTVELIRAKMRREGKIKR